MELGQEWLTAPAHDSLRRWALGLVRTARAAADELAEGGGANALHDYRVAARRLRTCLRVYRAELGRAGKRGPRNRLGKLVRVTNGGRDAEVALEWLDAERKSIRGRNLVGFRWLYAHLRARRDDGYKRARESVRLEHALVFDELAERIARYEVCIDLPGPAMSTLVGETIAALGTELGARLREVRSLGDVEAAHAARLAGKRLRYALEPLSEIVPAAKDLLDDLRRLQSALGDINDMNVLADDVAAAIELAAAGRVMRLDRAVRTSRPAGKRVRAELRNDERPGLLEIARRIEQRRAALFIELANEWLAEHVDRFGQRIDATVAAITTAAKHGVEIERKWLLRGVPELAPSARRLEIDQGWLAGTKLRERLRRTKSSAGVEHTRTVKLGSGLKRIEVEEEMTPELFAQLWPLTRGRRVRKRRYEVEERGLVFQVDVFRDRELVLLEVELPNEHESVKLPRWLKSQVVREVTTEAAYVNANLAK